MFSPGNNQWCSVSLVLTQVQNHRDSPQESPLLSGGSISALRSWLALGWGMALAHLFALKRGLQLLIFKSQKS